MGNTKVLLFCTFLLGAFAFSALGKTCKVQYDIRALDMSEKEHDHSTQTETEKTMRLELAYLEVIAEGSDVYIDMGTTVSQFQCGPDGCNTVEQPLPQNLQGLQKLSEVYQKLDAIGQGSTAAQLIASKVFVLITGCNMDNIPTGGNQQSEGYGCSQGQGGGDSGGGEKRRTLSRRDVALAELKTAFLKLDAKAKGGLRKEPVAAAKSSGMQKPSKSASATKGRGLLNKETTMEEFRESIQQRKEQMGRKKKPKGYSALDETIVAANKVSRENFLQRSSGTEMGRRLEGSPPAYMAYPMPTFKDNVVSQFFQYFPPGGGGMNFREPNINLRFSPFTSVNDKYDKATDTCTLMVKLGNDTDAEELVSVDNVDYSCIKNALAVDVTPRPHYVCDQSGCREEQKPPYKGHMPGEIVGLNIYLGLEGTTGAAPGRGEVLKIVTKNSAGNTTTRYAKATYENYRKLKGGVEQKERESHKLKCWKSYWDVMSSFDRGQATVGECQRPSANAREAMGKKKAVDAMISDKYPFVVFKRKFNLETGKESNDMKGYLDWDANKKGTKTCTAMVNGLLDVNGDNLCGGSYPLQRMEPLCSYGDIKNVTAAMDKMLSDVSDGKLASSWEALMTYTGTDTWFACSNLILETVEIDGGVEITEETSGCIHPFPNTCGDPMQYCRDDGLGVGKGSDDPWCKSPCCNWEKANRQCCRPEQQTYFKPVGKIIPEKIADLCMDGSSDEVLKVSATVMNGQQFVDASLEPQECFADKKRKEKELKKIDDIVECCVQAVIGEMKQDGMMGGMGGGESKDAVTSNQKCTTNNDCYTGECAVSTTEGSGQSNSNSQSNSQSSSQSSSNSNALTCYTTEEENGKTNTCKLAKQGDQGSAMAKCIVDRLQKENMHKAVAFLRKRFANGNFNAADSVIGQGILAGATRSTCQGRSGWRFDPDNWCQDWNRTSSECIQNCEGDSQCKTMCLADQSCNHDVSKPANECAGSGSRTHFCAEKMPWGDIYDKTEYGSCGIGDEWSMRNINSTECSTLQPAATLFPVGQEWQWSDTEQKHMPTDIFSCGFSSNGEDSSKSICLDNCTNADGPRPAEEWVCVLPYDMMSNDPCSDSGGLAGTPNVTSNVRFHEDVDWNIDLPWFVPRPRFCRYSYCNEWAYNSQSSQWEERGCPNIERTYPSNATAFPKCQAAFGPTAIARLVQNVDEQCSNMMCYSETIASENACNEWRNKINHEKTALGLSQMHFWADWQKDFNGGSGRCMLQRFGMTQNGDYVHGWRGSHRWPADGGAYALELTNNKAQCETFNGTFYLGRKFKAGKRDTQEKCNKPYCNLVGPEYAFTAKQCAALPGECNSWHCKGCDTNWGAQNRKERFCYNVTVDKAGCETGGDTYSDSGGFCWKSDTSAHECKSPWEYVERCGDLDFDHCSGSASAPNTPLKHAISTLMGCIRSGRTKCKTPNACENEGACYGSLRSTYWVNGKQNYYTHVCVLEKEATELEPWPNCNGYKKGCAEGSSWCHDENIEETRKKCVSLYEGDETNCTAKGGTWTSTVMTKSTCLAETECQTKMGWRNEMSASECAACGGTNVPANHWHSGKWQYPAMVTSSVTWTLKQMEAENEWITVIDKWKLSDSLRSIKDQLSQEVNSAFTACLYGRQGSALMKVAAACGQVKLESERLRKILDAPFSVAAVKTMPNVEDSGGISTKTNVKLSNESVTAEGELNINQVLFIPGASDKEETAAGTAKRLLSQLANSVIPSHFKRRLKEKTTNDASCYSSVTNADGFIVGQLVGDCVVLEMTAGQETFNDPPRLCIETRPSIEKDPAFTVPDFSSQNGSVYVPLAMTVQEAGKHYCGYVPKAGTYCPVRRIANFQAATENAVSNECSALDSIVKQAVLAKKCKMGDRKSCGWFQKGSISAAIAMSIVATILIIVGVKLIILFFCHRHRHVLKTQFSQRFFKKIDVDGSGRLDAGEVNQMLKKEYKVEIADAQVQGLMEKFGHEEMDYETYKLFLLFIQNLDETDSSHNVKTALENYVKNNF